MSKIPQELLDDVYIAESYLVGLFWASPDTYIQYTEDKISHKTFGNRIWKFFFYLGRKLSEQNIKIYDDITVEDYLQEKDKIRKEYEEYGGYNTIHEMVNEVKDKLDNFDGYFSMVKKYNLLRELYSLLGEQVIIKTNKYNYKILNSEQISTYWQDKLNNILITSESKIEEYNLLEGLEELIDELNINPDMGMPFNNSKDMTNICNGWDYGHLYMISGFSGTGKTSITLNKVIISCIKNKEKLLIIANEMGIKDYQKLLLITLIGNDLYDWLKQNNLKGFYRQNIDKGNFSDEDLKKLKKASEIAKKMVNNELDLIKFVPIDIYTMSNVEKTLRYYANRGYRRVIIDTAKPTEGNKERWVQFVEDFEKLDKLTRAEAGGLNLSLWTTVQAGDGYIHERFLTYDCLGDAKKIKNVASVVWHLRKVWDDEYEGEKNELTCYRYSQNSNTPKGYELEEFTLKKSNSYQYMLMFTSKNRRGQSNETGLDVLVFKTSLNSNTWREVGWTKIYNC
ncbi:replicative DNA helicase [Clostridium botulinum B str. Osaka05]|uniref:Replicative DNA helicase n=1 Tax=Clostridium botulinum B str. Osaka05 TaxID=1407017 RepID=A0A060N305_CLOBO|nr:DnaB-like helicase C-terminal domain-containing protein [Clostridium botulinum]BAO04761.1 replicative DNA helicase [Clostridium botulinum B str. Osaka05]